MKIYRNIAIFKNDNATGSQPTHAMTASDEKYKNKVNVASLWTKDGQKGKFLSGQMKNEYKSEKGNYPAYVIVQEDELNALIQSTKTPERIAQDAQNQKEASQISNTPLTDEELESMKDIPF